ncbi:hypothetical protein CC78DRAFT_576049 [Lojkania enalia]|uniref:Uncharacterized protein n=1 Tax=Lojkania enalia TaxID=147567 RepID=A0A9P4KH27_9PLEO|nr:hypothetical protein CC78DRAFT_576049 [Didymosphaeria enalia]
MEARRRRPWGASLSQPFVLIFRPRGNPGARANHSLLGQLLQGVVPFACARARSLVLGANGDGCRAGVAWPSIGGVAPRLPLDVAAAVVPILAAVEDVQIQPKLIAKSHGGVVMPSHKMGSERVQDTVYCTLPTQLCRRAGAPAEREGASEASLVVVVVVVVICILLLSTRQTGSLPRHDQQNPVADRASIKASIILVPSSLQPMACPVDI